MMQASLLLIMCTVILAACEVPKPGKVISYPDADTADFQVYASNCSECHAPPLPTAHRANEWPNVIARMQQHRIQRSIAPIAAADIALLRRYLESHAAAETP